MSPFLVFVRAAASLSFPSTSVLRERVNSSVILHWSRFYTLPDAARSREGLPAPCQAHHLSSEHPSAAEGIGAAPRAHLVWDVSLRAATRSAAAVGSAAGSALGSAAGSEVDYAAWWAQRALRRRTRVGGARDASLDDATGGRDASRTAATTK